MRLGNFGKRGNIPKLINFKHCPSSTAGPKLTNFVSLISNSCRLQYLEASNLENFALREKKLNVIEFIS